MLDDLKEKKMKKDVKKSKSISNLEVRDFSQKLFYDCILVMM
jgi:hypothetical protein